MTEAADLCRSPHKKENSPLDKKLFRLLIFILKAAKQSTLPSIIIIITIIITVIRVVVVKCPSTQSGSSSWTDDKRMFLFLWQAQHQMGDNCRGPLWADTLL